MNKSGGATLTKKKVLFITGTRADFGKLKSLIRTVETSEVLEYSIFVTGMHTLSRYGHTVEEVYKSGFRNVHMHMNHKIGESMDIILANTIEGLSRYISEYNPDMIVVHGDRVEAMAGAIVGALNNILVAHIEGGELSGTIDELIRHAITKLSHIHFVANKEAKHRLIQLGEIPDHIFVIGSPDIDIMNSSDLPTITEAKKYYGILFDQYSIALFHPVTTETEKFTLYTNSFVDTLLESDKNYVVIYPNNDPGCDIIIDEYKRLEKNSRFRIFPSLRFEYFLALLKECDFIIGNSSCGVREAPVYGKPSINIGTRQHNRAFNQSIFNVGYSKKEILEGIQSVEDAPTFQPSLKFGKGKSHEQFIKQLEGELIWKTTKQKQFLDLSFQTE